MLPRWHILLGIIFCTIFKIISPETSYVSIFLIWFASVFIDFDHYLAAGFTHRKWNPLEALNHGYERRDKILEQKEELGMCEKGDFHFFHTIEAHLLVGVIALFLSPFYFIFIGMIFHSLLDLVWMVRHDVLDSREFFAIRRLRTLVL
ncbi:MAG: hypothetical protein AABX10_05225 [Nanoarchaeota archaeon]